MTKKIEIEKLMPEAYDYVIAFTDDYRRQFVFVGAKIPAFFGYDSTSAFVAGTGNCFDRLLWEGSLSAALGAIGECRSGDGKFYSELAYSKKPKPGARELVNWMALTGRVSGDGDDAVVLAEVQEISERIRSQEERMQLNEYMFLMLGLRDEITYCVDYRLKNVIVFKNERSEIVDALPLELIDELNIDDSFKVEYRTTLYDRVVGEPVALKPREFHLVNKTGEAGWYNFQASLLKTLSGSPKRCVGRLMSISEFKSISHEQKFRLQYDFMTKLLNRDAAINMIEKQLLTAGHYILIITDIDNFKDINDVCGHPIGDDALRAVAKSFLDKFPDDICGRLGGDEFVIFIRSGLTIGQIEERLKHVVVETNQSLGHLKLPGGTLTFSAGGAFAAPLSDYLEMYRRADKKLYEAKREGKNTVRF